MRDDDAYINEMLAWVKGWVVAHNLCPFAAPSLAKNALLLRVSHGPDTAGRLLDLMRLLAEMEAEPSWESALLILPALKDFDHFLDELALAEALLRDQGYTGDWQLASFHPHYRFAGEAADDASHYTNRAPHPAWHLIRESVMSRATARIDDPLAIPRRNIRLLRAMGVEEIRRRLARLQHCGREDSS